MAGLIQTSYNIAVDQDALPADHNTLVADVATLFSAYTPTIVTASGPLVITAGGVYVFAKTTPGDPNLITLPVGVGNLGLITIVDGTGNFNVNVGQVTVSGGGNIMGRAQVLITGSYAVQNFLWVSGSVNQYIGY